MSARGLKGKVTGYEILYQNFLLKRLEDADIPFIVKEGAIVTASADWNSYAEVHAYAHLCHDSGWLQQANDFLSKVSAHHSALWQGFSVNWQVWLA